MGIRSPGRRRRTSEDRTQRSIRARSPHTPVHAAPCAQQSAQRSPGGPRIQSAMRPHSPGMIARSMPPSEPSLAQRLLAGDKRALARAITLVENDDPAGWELVREVYPAHRAGVGHRLHRTAWSGEIDPARGVDQARAGTGAQRGCSIHRPSSPFTNGALLGDRIRLTEHFLDPGVFIRSMANRGALGGLSEAALQAALLMDASGRDVVLLETVGVGAGRGRHHRPRRHRRARADARGRATRSRRSRPG